MPRNPHPDPILSMRGRMGAHVAHSRNDPHEITAKARATYRASFETVVDPAGLLAPDERARRADHLRRAHYVELALKSAVARRARAVSKKPSR